MCLMIENTTGQQQGHTPFLALPGVPSSRRSMSTDDNISLRCLAAVQFLRSHFQEATDMYKRILVDNREHLAVNVYIAACYYKLDYYDVAIEILQTYLAQFPDSITGVNLKSCAHYQLYNGKAAEAELKVLQQQSESPVFQEHDLLRHNVCVFRNGENAMQVKDFSCWRKMDIMYPSPRSLTGRTR